MWRKGLRAVTSCSAMSSVAASDAANARSSIAPGANSCASSRRGSDLPNSAGASLCIVKNHPERMTVPGTNAAHTVAKIHTIHPAGARYRAMMDGEDDRVPPAQTHALGSRLHARALFAHDELTAPEVLARLRQQDRQLQRKDTFAVEILVEAVVVTGAILQQERRGTRLTGVVTAGNEFRVRGRITNIELQLLVPAV